MSVNDQFPLCSISPLRMETDGAGVTTLVVSYGCPLRCKWCINARTLHMPETVKRISCEELYDQVKAYDLYFLATGGGLTFGGGEPLLHAKFLYAFMTKYQNGWKYNIETSLQVPWKDIESLVTLVDFFIVDIKSMNPNTYECYTGGSFGQMEQNLTRLLAAVGAERIKIRIPLIPNFNTKEEQEWSKERILAMGFTNIELFPYIDPSTRK